jgi:uncharacterized phage infection (PIP) family protein YhgE
MNTTTTRAGAPAGSSSNAQPKTVEHTEARLQPSISDVTDTLRSQASEATKAASSLADDMKEAARSASRAVKQQASEFASEVGHELSKTADSQKARGAEAIQGIARAINSAAEELESQSPQVAKAVRNAASKVENLSTNLGNHSIDQLMKAATDLARQQPVLFIGGAVAAGFALSRFLKSSAGNDGSEQDLGVE